MKTSDEKKISKKNKINLNNNHIDYSNKQTKDTTKEKSICFSPENKKSRVFKIENIKFNMDEIERNQINIKEELNKGYNYKNDYLDDNDDINTTPKMEHRSNNIKLNKLLEPF